jgi:hypothetical protein
MGHKGVSIRKIPKARTKPATTTDHSGGAVSGLNQSPESTGKQLPGNDGLRQSGRGGQNPTSGSKGKRKSH